MRHAEGLITCEHYANTINAQGASPRPALRALTPHVSHAFGRRLRGIVPRCAGLACDPRTGEVIPCSGYSPPPPRSFAGATAKAVAVAVLEAEGGVAPGADGAGCVSRLEHAAYLGRELQRAEEALRYGTPYVQD